MRSVSCAIIVRIREKAGLVLSLDTIYVGPAYDKVKPPRYPSSALRGSRQPELHAIVKFSDGGIASEIAYSAESDTAKEFRENVTGALKGWTFKPETVDGIAVGGSMRVPVLFSMNCFRSTEAMTGEGEPQTTIVRLAPVLGLKQRTYGDAIGVTGHLRLSGSRRPPPDCEPSAQPNDR